MRMRCIGGAADGTWWAVKQGEHRILIPVHEPAEKLPPMVKAMTRTWWYEVDRNGPVPILHPIEVSSRQSWERLVEHYEVP